ncbi:RNA polymerase factor sigma-54 [Fluviispira multicolorata]|uniref:RNA polymerase factor sigma-54 n=1 Tax=Fluviispira multicolorata TaxID=2654512 RepID=A0A833JD86_9BACT|nr:RNA polymerase factor sigma-54 [Fluviispira multicolorata]KAB8031773.1 RNA polymerase factor sigma-54 [Fluviispira multicolorata]
MALEIKQGLKTSQKISLSTELKNSITVLTLGRIELEKFVNNELEKNPCLEDASFSNEVEQRNHYEELKLALQKSFNQSDFLEKFNDIKSSENISSSNQRREFADNSSTSSIHDFLENQMSTLRLSPYEKECINIVLQYMDDNGFINTDIKVISENHAIHFDDLIFALENIQKCEPVGVGARSLQESLLLQYKKLEKKSKIVEKLLADYWEEFQKQNFQKIAKNEKTTLEEIKDAFRFIKSNLDPRPARQFGSQTNQIIIPDVFVYKRESQWICSLNENDLPRLKLSKKYTKLIKEIKENIGKKNDKETYKYISENIKSAKWLVRSLAERDKTILKVVDTIIKYQSRFFEYGVDFLTPMTLKVIAQELNLHESTISRATSGKYLYSPRGIFELKYFFNASVENNFGKEYTNEAVKQQVAEFIKNENKNKPLSDQEIAEKIHKEKNIKIARRTVSKYRESLGISSSSKRIQKF